ncbi:MAG: SDR family NAD(P)-dependent oxidoreductase [Sphingorhabdus sp.]
MGRLTGKVAIITGAASGIGQGSAHVFAREGARLILSDINADGEATAQAIRDAGGDAEFIAGDVSSEDANKALVEAAIHHFGRLDIAFNNAGIGGDVLPLDQQSEANWRRVFEVDLLSVAMALKHQLPVMREQGGGSIIVTTSNSGIRALDGLAVYSAMKAGLMGLTRVAALEGGPDNVRVNAIAPGLISTPAADRDEWAKKLRIPMGRAGTVEEIGQVAAFLASDAASYLSGQVISVDGAATV